MNKDFFEEFFKRTGYGILQYIKAIVISSIVNFIILIIGLKYAGVPYYALIAFAIAIADLLPVVGAGFVLIPWSLIVLLQGNTSLAAILIIIYVVTFVVKQVLEPIILGKSIGLKPLYTILITVVSMIILTPAIGAIVGALVSIMVAVYLDMIKGNILKDNNDINLD